MPRLLVLEKVLESSWKPPLDRVHLSGCSTVSTQPTYAGLGGICGAFPSPRFPPIAARNSPKMWPGDGFPWDEFRRKVKGTRWRERECDSWSPSEGVLSIAIESQIGLAITCLRAPGKNACMWRVGLPCWTLEYETGAGGTRRAEQDCDPNCPPTREICSAPESQFLLAITCSQAPDEDKRGCWVPCAHQGTPGRPSISPLSTNATHRVSDVIPCPQDMTA